MQPDFEEKVEIRSIHHADKPLIDFPITLVDITKLHPHEMVIEDAFEGLVEQLKKDKHLKTPILISKDFIILDGHHRYSALRKLGVQKIPAIVLDYDDDNLVKVDTWYPVLQESLEVILSTLKQNRFEIEELLGDYKDIIKRRKATAVVGNKQKKYLVYGEREDIYAMIREFWLKDIRYADIPELAFSMTSDNVTAVVSWPYTKDEIREKGKSNTVFLPKTTRHFMDFQFPDYRVELKDLY